MEKKAKVFVAGHETMAVIIEDAVGFKGDIIFDTGKHDGMPRKLLEVSGIKK